MMAKKSESTDSEFAWKVHDALDSWTGKVDTKASIVLAIETAAVGFVVTMSSDDNIFTGITGTNLAWYRAGILLLALSAFLSLIVVLPQLNRWKVWRNKRATIIYFGHLRHWQPKKLAKELAKSEEYNEQIATQLVSMAKIAWRKHAWLQWSLICFALACACLAVAA